MIAPHRVSGRGITVAIPISVLTSRRRTANPVRSLAQQYVATAVTEGSDVGDNLEAMRQVLERGFGAGDLSVADEFAGPTIVEHEYAAPAISSGPDLLKAMINEARSQVPDLTLSLRDAVADGDKVWARSEARGRNPRTDAQLTFTVIDICRFEDGRIVEHWGVPDRFALLDQLGVLVPRQATFARFTSSRSCLSWALRFRQAM